jgi:DNA-binding CsgD family transcriptional regulator
MGNFDEALMTLHENLDLGTFSRRALATSTQIAPADIGSYIEVNLEERTAAATSDHEFAASPSSANCWVGQILNDDVIPFWRQAKAGRACRIEDFTTHAEFSNKMVYREFFRPRTITQLVMVTLRAHNGTIRCLGLGRERRPFCDEEKVELNRIAPHLAMAHGLAERLSLCHRGESRFVSVLEWVRFEKILVARTGMVRESTECARRWIHEFFGPPVSYSCTLQSELWDELRIGLGEVGACVLKTRSAGTDRLTASAVVGPSDNISILLERRTPIDPTEAREALGLARVQFEIVRALLEREGATIGQIAEGTGRNKATLNTQAKRIYNILGVKRRAQLKQAVHDRLVRWSMEQSDS